MRNSHAYRHIKDISFETQEMVMLLCELDDAQQRKQKTLLHEPTLLQKILKKFSKKSS